jgi:hypothetical protein
LVFHLPLELLLLEAELFLPLFSQSLPSLQFCRILSWALPPQTTTKNSNIREGNKARVVSNQEPHWTMGRLPNLEELN